MDLEIKAMKRTNTWKLFPYLLIIIELGANGVYKVKYKPDGTIDCYIARLVAKGYNQQKGIDFLDTLSPVAKIVTVKVLLTRAASFNWFLAQMNISNAFLNEDLFEEVYMALPLGYKTDVKGENLVCKVNKLSMD